MFIPLSFFGELGDIEVIEHNGRLHLFHLTIPNHDLIGHAVSDDGLSWEALQPALHTGNPGDCDDDQIWTMSVTKRANIFYMLYTALSKKDKGRIQRNCLAISKDLIKWKKYHKNPVGQASPKYYEAAAVRNILLPFVSWRDPKPFYEKGVYYCVVCGREKTAPVFRRGSFALMTSTDLIHWKVAKPLFAPKSFYDCECPQLFKIGNYYYLFASISEEGSQRYWFSKEINGDYITPPNNVLFSGYSGYTHAAGRVTMFKGEHIFCCWSSIIADGPSPFGLVQEIGSAVRYFPSPLKISQSANGIITLSPYTLWQKYRKSRAKNFSFSDFSLLTKNRKAKFDPETYSLKVKEGMEIVTNCTKHKNFLLEGIIKMDAPAGGLAFNLDDGSMGYFIKLLPYESRAKLVKHISVGRGTFDWFKYEVRTESFCNLENIKKQGIAFSLRVVNGEIEFALNNTVFLSTISTERTSGFMGFWVDCGEVRIDSFQITEMNVPFNR